MTGTLNIFVEAMRELAFQMAALFPKLVFAILIWVIGKYLLNLGVQLIRKIKIKGTELDGQIINFLTKIALPLGKFILVLIVLDYLSIGRTVIGAFMNGLTWTIAIALGIAFGSALKEDASQLVSGIKKHIKK